MKLLVYSKELFTFRILNKLLKYRKLITFFAIAWTILIFIGCSLPGKDIPAVSVFDHFDKVVHFTFFFVFAVLWYAVFYKQFNRGALLLVLVIVSFAYGFGLEWYQINFVPGRAWDVWDGVADGIGGILGVLFVLFFSIGRD